MNSPIDPMQCPLCQQNNHCGVNGIDECWCVSSDIKPELLTKVPKELAKKSCICQQCIDKYNAVAVVKKS